MNSSIRTKEKEKLLSLIDEFRTTDEYVSTKPGFELTNLSKWIGGIESNSTEPVYYEIKPLQWQSRQYNGFIATTIGWTFKVVENGEGKFNAYMNSFQMVVELDSAEEGKRWCEEYYERLVKDMLIEKLG